MKNKSNDSLALFEKRCKELFNKYKIPDGQAACYIIRRAVSILGDMHGECIYNVELCPHKEECDKICKAENEKILRKG